MKRFRFRLAKLLDLAHRDADEARRAAGAALAALQTAEARLEAGYADRAAAEALLAKDLSGGAIDLRSVLSRQEHITVIGERIVRLKADTAKKLAAYDRAREVVAEKRGKELLFERERDKKWEEWRDEAAKVEMAQMDETAIQRFSFRRHESTETDS